MELGEKMIDRSIPYYNLILKCTKICTTPVSLPEGYSFKLYDVGDEKYWAKLEYATVANCPIIGKQSITAVTGV